MNELEKMKNMVSKSLFGVSISEAHSRGLCLNCRQPYMERCYSEAGVREYAISGFCEICFDNLFKNSTD